MMIIIEVAVRCGDERNKIKKKRPKRRSKRRWKTAVILI